MKHSVYQETDSRSAAQNNTMSTQASPSPYPVQNTSSLSPSVILCPTARHWQPHPPTPLSCRKPVSTCNCSLDLPILSTSATDLPISWW